MKKNRIVKKVEHYKNTELIDIDGEEWIDVIGYDGIYEVSNYGRIKSLDRYILNNRGSEYLKKGRVLKQAVDTSSLKVTLCVDGVCKRLSASRITFFSFNYNVENLPEYHVMHKDNDWKNNNLSNLRIGTREEIAQLTFDKGKMNHLKEGNPILSKFARDTAKVVDGKVVSRLCMRCNNTKDVSLFRYGRNKCKQCESEETIEKKGCKKRRCRGLKSTDQVTGEVVFYKNYNDKKLLNIVSMPTAIKGVKNKAVIKPYLKKHNFNPFILEEI